MVMGCGRKDEPQALRFSYHLCSFWEPEPVLCLSMTASNQAHYFLW